MAHFPFFVVQDRFARGTEGYSLYISKMVYRRVGIEFESVL